MYHEVKNALAWPNMSYYDKADEIPDICKVYFPDKTQREMSSKEMLQLASNEDWYVIVNECNYGVCDHWVSIPFSKWINKYYPKIIQFVCKQGDVLGYSRKHQCVRLTKDKNFRKSEVWNS